MWNLLIKLLCPKLHLTNTVQKVLYVWYCHSEGKRHNNSWSGILMSWSFGDQLSTFQTVNEWKVEWIKLYQYITVITALHAVIVITYAPFFLALRVPHVTESLCFAAVVLVWRPACLRKAPLLVGRTGSQRKISSALIWSGFKQHC